MFEPGSKTGDIDCVTVMLVDDNRIEKDETLWLSLEENEAVSVDEEEERVAMVIEDNEGMFSYAFIDILKTIAASYIQISGHVLEYPWCCLYHQE